MAEIKVEKIFERDKGWEFDVEVIEGDSKTQHRVTMNRAFYENLGTDTTPEKVVEKSFEFLLEREPKESILRGFDVTVISRYFPEYGRKLRRILKSKNRPKDHKI